MPDPSPDALREAFERDGLRDEMIFLMESADYQRPKDVSDEMLARIARTVLEQAVRKVEQGRSERLAGADEYFFGYMEGRDDGAAAVRSLIPRDGGEHG